jgi:hypothetical protein
MQKLQVQIMWLALGSLRPPGRRVPQLSAKRRGAQAQVRGLRGAKKWRARAQARGLRMVLAAVQPLRTLELLLIGIRRRARR